MGELYTAYQVTDGKVKDYEKYERTIKTINKRFKTYGYERIKTPTFELYDLYREVKSAIHPTEMVKLINEAGEVLVLRPDVTIPITKQLAEQNRSLQHEAKYYYVQDVFRQLRAEDSNVETTQAGVEYFCQSSPEKDAEVIALACHTLKDLGFQNITIEIGHVRFVQSLIEQIELSDRQMKQLKSLIQSKNMIELNSFLNSLQIEQSSIASLKEIPILYGSPADVIKQAKKMVQNDEMDKTVNYLLDLYKILKMYRLDQYIVFNLSLINHMNYYSHMIFQGFVEQYGRPVLMGGRYDRLGDEFNASLPAIGFACTVESLLDAMKTEHETIQTPIDCTIFYEPSEIKQSIIFANELRERNYIVTTNALNEQLFNPRPSIYRIDLTKEAYRFIFRDKTLTFQTMQQLLVFMNEMKGGIEYARNYLGASIGKNSKGSDAIVK